MTVTLEDVSLLLGLPLQGAAVVSPEIGADWMQDILHRFQGVLPPPGEGEQQQMDFSDKHGPTKAWLLQF